MSKFRIIQESDRLFRINQQGLKELNFSQVDTPWYIELLSYLDFLWVGDIIGDRLISITSGNPYITITGKDFSTNYIPDSSAALFTLMSDPVLTVDDWDECWFAGGVQKNNTVLDLIGTDRARTWIKYASDAPYNITAIGIAKNSLVLDDVKRNRIAELFQLWILWSEELN